MAEEEINTAGADVSVAAPETSNEPDVSAALDEIYEAHTAPEDEAASPKLQKPAEQQATATGEPQAKDEAQLAEQQAAKQAPHTWTKEEKAAWDAAPEQVKQALYRRAEQVEAYAQSLMETKGFADAMRPIGETLVQLQPYFEGFAGADGKPLWGNPRAIAEEIKALAQVKADFVRNPAQGLSNIIAWGREQGIDMISALREIVHGIEHWPDAESVKLRADAER